MLMMLNRLEVEMTVYAESADDDWLHEIYNTSFPADSIRY